ncbi:MAG: alpha/beta fold hydrolase [Planctomycetales bacterium]|nr:alpha/beta fold hydrolase [Planctomycetales bacterium]
MTSNTIRRVTSSTLAWMCALTFLGDSAGGAEKTSPAARYRVQRDGHTHRTTVRVDVNGDHVLWRDVIAGVAHAKGYEESEIAESIPGCKLRLDSRWFRCVSRWCNSWFDCGGVDIRSADSRDPGKSELVMHWDDAKIQEKKRQVKDQVRGFMLGHDLRRATTEYGLLYYDRRTLYAPLSQPLVVVVHGYNSRPQDVERLIEKCRDRGYPCAAFRYPNDQSIDRSGKQLATSLREFARQSRGRQVAIVSHSMGGLVARAAIEHPKRDPGNVSHLIMVAPPNGGSGLARFAVGLDVWEFVRHSDRRSDWNWLYACVEDGLAEASNDLEPDSVFLTQLNRLSRNPRVDYTIFLGDSGARIESRIKDLQRPLDHVGQVNRWTRFACSKYDRWFDDLDELEAGKGDGVVSLARGRLKGVDDIRVAHFHHNEILSDQDAEIAMVLTQIADCVQR